MCKSKERQQRGLGSAIAEVKRVKEAKSQRKKEQERKQWLKSERGGTDLSVFDLRL